MRIVKVSLNVSRKISLPEYSNVSFALGMEADIAEGEDAFTLADTLRKDAVAYVEEQCNQALEREGQPAKFYEGLLYDVVAFLDYVLIVQHDSGYSVLPVGCRNFYTGHRWSGAVALAKKLAGERGWQFSADSMLIGEPDAVRDKVIEIVEASGAIAMYAVGRVRRGDKNVWRHAIIPLGRVLFDEDLLGYQMYRARALAEAALKDDWRPTEIVEVASVEVLQALIADAEADIQADDGEVD